MAEPARTLLRMSGGIAYVLDQDTDLYKKLNKELVSMEAVTEKYDVLELKSMIEEHVKHTDSAKGKAILEHFGDYRLSLRRLFHMITGECC